MNVNAWGAFFDRYGSLVCVLGLISFVIWKWGLPFINSQVSRAWALVEQMRIEQRQDAAEVRKEFQDQASAHREAMSKAQDSFLETLRRQEGLFEREVEKIRSRR